jgi:hypothetical protein
MEMQSLYLIAILIFLASASVIAPTLELPAIEQTTKESEEKNNSANIEIRQQLTPTTAEALCAQAATASSPICETLEQKILASVVRLWIRGPAVDDHTQHTDSIGHGTVVAGRYLVTHNHFQVDIAFLEQMPHNGAAAVSLYRASGERIVVEALPNVFTIVYEDRETLVLDFGIVEDKGFFETHGLQSARLSTWHEIRLGPEMHVAQVDWDGERAHIDWVAVNKIVTQEGTPRLVLSNGVSRGASGGGIFWNGYHIANNWSLIETVGADGNVLRQVTIAALNSEAAATY